MLALLLALVLAVVTLVTCDCIDRVNTRAQHVKSVAAPQWLSPLPICGPSCLPFSLLLCLIAHPFPLLQPTPSTNQSIREGK